MGGCGCEQFMPITPAHIYIHPPTPTPFPPMKRIFMTNRGIHSYIYIYLSLTSRQFSKDLSRNLQKSTCPRKKWFCHAFFLLLRRKHSLLRIKCVCSFEEKLVFGNIRHCVAVSNFSFFANTA